jgi:1,4-dihydroxy-6-naphthoate synthase
MRPISLGFSPCPNDTFIFDALVHGRVDAGGLAFNPRLEDVETLNALAAAGELQVSKVSYGALPGLLGEYVLLRSGGALGRSCGPLLVAQEPRDLRGARIAIPGERTTAYLLLRLWKPDLPPGIPTPYSEIMPAVARGEVDAGLIIHESRFTYQEYGLTRLVDLGEWWERETGLPIPLGGIVARRSLGRETIVQIERAICRSVEYAFEHPDASRAYVSAHAQEMDPAVMRAHIDLYVNKFSLWLGSEGEEAVRALVRRTKSKGLRRDTPDVVFHGSG